MLELSEKVPAREVFSSPAPIPEDVREAMDTLCLEVGKKPPPPQFLQPDRLQAYLVGHLSQDSRRKYRNLFPGPR